MILDKLHELDIEADGNVPALRKHIAQHLDSLQNFCKNKEFESNQIYLWKERDPKKFESIHVIDLKLIYAACTTDRHIASIITKRDGIGIRRNYKPLNKYGSDWNEVSSMCTTNGQLYVAHGSGVDEVSLATLNVVRIISAWAGECLIPHTAAPHGDGVVVSDPEKHCVLKWSRCERNVQVFAGDSTTGNNDGLQQNAGFFSPLVFARNSTTWYTFATPKQAVSRYSQPLRKPQNSLRVLESCFIHFPSTKSTRRTNPVTFQLRSLGWAGAYRF